MRSDAAIAGLRRSVHVELETGATLCTPMATAPTIPLSATVRRTQRDRPLPILRSRSTASASGPKEESGGHAEREVLEKNLDDVDDALRRTHQLVRDEEGREAAGNPHD
jgi:hypothetical protein